MNRRLIVPAFLAISACGGGDKTSVSSSSGEEPETAGDTRIDPSTTTMATSTSATGTGSSTGVTTGSETGSETGSDSSGDATTGGELPDCSVPKDEKACQAVTGCVWDGEMCTNNCLEIKNQATCDTLPNCLWIEGTCYPPI